MLLNINSFLVWQTYLLQFILWGLVFFLVLRLSPFGFFLNLILILVYAINQLSPWKEYEGVDFLVFGVLPLLFLNSTLYAFTDPSDLSLPSKAAPIFRLKKGSFKIKNVFRGVAIIGAAGSGKTESVVYHFLKHFRQHSFCGVIHDYKNFELTEIAYPLFKSGDLPFYILSFDTIYHRTNPIAPIYLTDEESVNEISRVLVENLLEQKEILPSGPSKFFNDAAEGLIAGLIWKLRTDYPQYCTLPHLVALYQYLDTESLVSFLSSNLTSKAMADAFISGTESERQTAAIRSTLANVLKKITTKRIFMALSADEIPLALNAPQTPSVVCVVNNPRFETSYSPAIATVIHTITKQMSQRRREPSFLLLEEAPTIRLVNMHRIPATLRSYKIATVYVMQDKIQNDILYGEKASKAILSNLSYQFFGKVNDPDTARYYERFFEIVKRQSISTSQSEGLNFDTRVTKTEKEASKIRAHSFFKLQPGEFVAFADGKDKKVKFKKEALTKALPSNFSGYTTTDLQENFDRIHCEVQSLFETRQSEDSED